MLAHTRGTTVLRWHKAQIKVVISRRSAMGLFLAMQDYIRIRSREDLWMCKAKGCMCLSGARPQPGNRGTTQIWQLR